MLCLQGTVSWGGIYYIADRKNKKKKAIIMTHPQPHQGFVEIYGADPEPENNLGRKFFGILAQGRWQGRYFVFEIWGVG